MARAHSAFVNDQLSQSYEIFCLCVLWKEGETDARLESRARWLTTQQINHIELYVVTPMTIHLSLFMSTSQTTLDVSLMSGITLALWLGLAWIAVECCTTGESSCNAHALLSMQTVARPHLLWVCCFVQTWRSYT